MDEILSTLLYLTKVLAKERSTILLKSTVNPPCAKVIAKSAMILHDNLISKTCHAYNAQTFTCEWAAPQSLIKKAGIDK